MDEMEYELLGRRGLKNVNREKKKKKNE